MKNQWRVIVGLLLVLLIVVFAILNSQEVPVNFGFTEINGPLILIILGSAIIGALIGLIPSTTTVIDQRKKIKSLNKEKEASDKEVDQLVAEAVAKEQQESAQQLAALQQQYDELVAKTTTELGQEIDM